MWGTPQNCFGNYALTWERLQEMARGLVFEMEFLWIVNFSGLLILHGGFSLSESNMFKQGF